MGHEGAMKISFVRPHLFDARASDALEPLVFAILAGLTPDDVEVRLFDERLEPLLIDEPADLAAITVETFTARRAYQIAEQYRRRGVPVVLGGYHPTFLPQEALEHADAVVSGDAESVWPQVVADARRNRLQRWYRGEPQALEGLTWDRRIFARRKYPPIATVQYGRGCRYACDFCSIHAFYGSTVRHRPPRDVAEEIARLERRSVLIVDDNLLVNRPAAEELFRALRPLNIRWGCQVSLDVADDPALLDLMAESGCIAALIGFESVEPANLQQMRKQWNLREGGYPAVIRRFHDRGIMIYGSFIFGYDHDTPGTIERTIEFAIESRLFLVNFTALTPTPGSRLYERLHKEGRLLYERWWLDPRYRYGDAVYRPTHLTPDQLTAACAEARQTFYRYGAIAQRGWRSSANRRTWRHLALFVGANLMTRRELSSKLGHPLGAATPLSADQTLESPFDAEECHPC
jgi:radical SAM superfamily enzyme YgiQ (UPF0313 family)